jgi:hypothetical protein
VRWLYRIRSGSGEGQTLFSRGWGA